uniref:Uncharacterized protein n=1 Tax=Arundo donax TaxID=35708 RepID=A0A0A9HDI3_ARUDO
MTTVPKILLEASPCTKEAWYVYRRLRSN